MLRIHFTVEDLARLRMVSDLGPLTESVFALNLLGGDDTVALRPWAKRVRAELGAAARFEWVLREHGPLPSLLRLVGPGGPERGDAPFAGRGAAAIAEFCRTVVLPYWGRIHTHLEQVRDARGRIVIANGLESLFGSLHPRLHWNPPVLELHHGPDIDVHLGGRGLLLSPSFFLHDRSCLVVDGVGEQGQRGLAFPIDAAMKAELWESREPDDQALGDLVGHTRAAALHALKTGCSTGMLAERLGISVAGASKHAAVLRRSGLITTTRQRTMALHELTPLGRALAQSHEPAAPVETAGTTVPRPREVWNTHVS
ncbi:ArsR/SmtB family transcription factor [Amycolatopsis sp. CA-230715]|uniref:ArsR/SmtB family transcription factor n=1 Tax=Amycolatopsis sp. CA-230715 TaxID=2745196 RepID=UPI001C037F51|nr:winged helix-turn-helix domain-containing protein [Amycolatopsis sp. CA-230715]QWF85959.1 hypothetical protein HUW46_09440 [Amycolatopsis sp. CA-230715]